jgi:hypothetical protein
VAGWRRTDAHRVYSDLMRDGFEPTALIDIAPACRVLYIVIPKAASSTIKAVLATTNGRENLSLREIHKRRVSKLKGPEAFSPASLHEIATSPEWFRFSFVRNPYARLVSCFADKFSGRVMSRNDGYADQLLSYRPQYEGKAITFLEFAEFACETAKHRINTHWNLQSDILAMPGISLDFIGKVESFDEDFPPIAERLGLPTKAGVHVNRSERSDWIDYYTPTLATMVQRAYQEDFDRFGYAYR